MKLAKLRMLAASVFCAASSAFSQDVLPKSADQVTDEQIAQVLGNITRRCVARGMQQHVPEEDVRATCACLDGVSRVQIPKADWQQIVFAGTKQDKATVDAILQRHADALNVCMQKR